MVKKSSSPTKRPKIEWWKIAGFTLGILLVAGAATYAVITRNSTAPKSPYSIAPALDSNLSAGALNIMGLGDLNWTQNLTAKFADHDLIFVMLPDSDIDSNNTLSNRISDAAAKIEARGARVEIMTLNSDDPEFSTTLQRLAVDTLPAVLVVSATGQGAIMTDDITEGQLLQIYLVVSQPICAPGSGSGCCGGK